jgi:hypothetical protein
VPANVVRDLYAQSVRADRSGMLEGEAEPAYLRFMFYLQLGMFSRMGFSRAAIGRLVEHGTLTAPRDAY